MRVLYGLFLAVAATSCGGSPSPVASPPPSAPAPAPVLGQGPTLGADRLVFDSNRAGGTHEIYVMGTDGSGPTRLTHDPTYQNWWPRVSPDRRKVLFYRAPAAHPESYAHASLWAMNTDGTALTQLRAQGENGWTMQGHAEWSPDGSQIAMFGSATVGTTSSLEIFVTDAGGKNPVQYTNRGGVNTDVSWSPNGAQLLFNGCAVASVCQPANYEIFVMNATPLAGAVQVTHDNLADYDAYFSPDGTRIAWLVNVDPTANVIPNTTTALGRWAIRIATIGQPASYLIDDGHINSKPAWSLDGQTIYFHRMVPSEGIRFRVFRISPNGTGLTELTPGAASGNSEHPSN